MIEKRGKISYDNRGSAIVTALVVSAVLMVLSLSLLAISYSLFLSQKKSTGDVGNTNDREMFYSAIEVFEQELLKGEHKEWDASADESIIEANQDDNSFGTKIVNSVLDYYRVDNEGNSLAKWPCYDPSDLNSDVEKVSRYFDIECLSSYDIKVQLYWEFDNPSSPNADMKGVLLHAIYRLTKEDKDIMQNERVYRMGVSYGNQVSVNNQQNNSTTGSYNINFEVSKYSDVFDPNLIYYKGFLPAAIKVADSNDDINSYYPENQPGIWYTESRLNELWNGTPKALYGVQEGDDYHRIARTDWDKEKAPICIKYVINGYVLDIDNWKYRYLNFGKRCPEEERHQLYKKSEIDVIISENLLKMCGVEGDDLTGGVEWYVKDGNEIYDFFTDSGSDTPEVENPDCYPYIKNPINGDGIYYVYAIFPSYDRSNLGNYTSHYEPERLINPYGSYTKYSFERIIGQ